MGHHVPIAKRRGSRPASREQAAEYGGSLLSGLPPYGVRGRETFDTPGKRQAEPTVRIRHPAPGRPPPDQRRR
ncbi:hypothetical protein Ssi02_14880 [Sinosporangium siamense]|uniref:Uncharacterized protein n=1 Tax=Sinosporangium siamense TaxID=1367973 RepID=A0A919RD54_9ACTN|nr:hypothetical protein Ssi02_14880 [Sinosporangium siamense]